MSFEPTSFIRDDREYVEIRKWNLGYIESPSMITVTHFCIHEIRLMGSARGMYRLYERVHRLGSDEPLGETLLETKAAHATVGVPFPQFLLRAFHDKLMLPFSTFPGLQYDIPKRVLFRVKGSDLLRRIDADIRPFNITTGGSSTPEIGEETGLQVFTRPVEVIPLAAEARIKYEEATGKLFNLVEEYDDGEDDSSED